jgi:MFS family permease
LIVVYGLFTGCTDGVGKAWISSLVGSDLQGSAQGVFQGASGFAVLIAGLWAGLLWGADGRLPLLVSGVVGGIFAVALLAAALRYRLGRTTSTSSSA